MASEPSSTTIASEPSTSTSEIQTDTSEPSQLEVLALNYLRNQEISTIPSRIPKLNPCSICQRVILKFRFQSFVVLDCEHLFHRLCLENYIMRAETDPFSLTCPSCNIIIELTREEAVLATGKYHLQKKQTDIGQGNEALMSSLGFMNDGSRAGQGSQSKQVTMQDQATSPIVIEDEDDDDNRSNSVDNRTPENQANSNDEIRATNTQDNLENRSNANSGDDTNVQESESQSRRNSSRRRTSPRITREQERFQALLQELSTPAKGEKAENDDDAEEDADGSASQSLARLYQKATRAGLRVTKANQDEILCWYKYAEGFENRVRDIRSQDSSATDPTARSRVYREVTQHLPGITEANLRRKTQKARNIYKVFVRIGTNKIKRVKSFSADAISSLSSTQIQSIIDRFSM